MMKWLTKGTSIEVHTIGRQEVISIRERRRNEKYARLHTIITFLCSFFPPFSTVTEVVLEGCLGSNMGFVFVWEFECDRHTESDEGQRLERS